MTMNDVPVTDADRERAVRIVEVTWADFMRDQNTPFYRPTHELMAAMACMALSGMVCERKVNMVAEEAKLRLAIEEEREACAKIADDLEYDRRFEFGWQKVADRIAELIRARSVIDRTDENAPK
jgi:hypothetical protein